MPEPYPDWAGLPEGLLLQMFEIMTLIQGGRELVRARPRRRCEKLASDTRCFSAPTGSAAPHRQPLCRKTRVRPRLHVPAARCLSDR